MTVFKVWNSHRTIKKCVVGNCLKDVIEKGRGKLNLNGDLTVVLEEDGTIIDEDDTLLEFASATLMLLEGTDTWRPTVEGSNASFISDADISVNSDSSTASPNTPEKHSIISDDVLENSTCTTFNTPRSTKSVKDIVLPTFSLLVQRHLKEGTPHLVWDQLVAEAANFYQATNNINSSTEYQAIGSKMYTSYPSIGMDGSKPWGLFTTNLSQRMRHMRWLGKKKSQPAPAHPSPSFPAAASTPKRRCSGVDVVCLPEEEYSMHLKQLQQEWRKPSVNRHEGHIKNLLKETFQNRQNYLRNLPDSVISPVLKSMPCLEEATYLLYDFRLLLGMEAFSGLKKSMAIFVEAVEALRGEKEEGAGRMLKCIFFIEKKTCFERGKKKMSSIIVQKEDVADEDMESELQTSPRTAPHIAVFSGNGRLKGSFICGDGTHIECQSDNISVAVLTLLATYYVLDLEYPQIYSQVLGLLQTYVVKTVPYDGRKSKNCFTIW